MEELADWDLLAVVRSCCTTTTSAATTTITSPAPNLEPPPAKQELDKPCFPNSLTTSSSFGFPTLFEPSASASTTSFLGGGQQEDLLDICKPHLICSNNATTTSSRSINVTNFQSLSSVSPSSSSSPVSSSSGNYSSVVAGRSFVIGEQPHLRRVIRPSQVVFGPPHPASAPQIHRTKKRKNLIKKVCHVPAEGLSNDMWAWRKYGQKPIKGSPYPRGYYRCSSSKGCLARKQVERNRSDPKMFIVTYTGEHNHPMPTHRNSLAGSTRQKPLPTDAPPQDQPACSSSSPSAASLSPPKTEEDNDMGISDLMLNDDFYVGFEKIDGGEDDGECFPDHLSPSSEFPWLVNSSSSNTATAAGGI